MKSLGERLRHILNNNNVTAYELGKGTGLNESLISRILNGKTLKPNKSNIDVICKYFNLNSEWLLHGTEPIYQSDSNINQPSTDMETNYLKAIMTLVDTNAKLLEENIALRSKVATLESSSLGERKQLTQSRT